MCLEFRSSESISWKDFRAGQVTTLDAVRVLSEAELENEARLIFRVALLLVVRP